MISSRVPSLLTTFVAILMMASSVWADGGATNETRALTLRECIERALENNLEIRFQRITPTIQTWGVMGAQGAAYDPVFSASMNYQDATTPLTPEQTTSLHLSSLEQKQLASSVGLTGKLPLGTTYDLFGSSTRTSGQLNSNFVYTGSSGISITQPILQNFGFGVNATAIRIARESRTIAIQNFVQFVMNTISNVATAYYELVYAIENHKAAVENRELARELLDQNRIQERVGTMSPLDVIQAEAGVAESEQSVITTARAIKDNENTLKRLICQQVSEFGTATLVPVDYPPVEMVALDVAESTRRALEIRPDYQSAYHALQSQNITVQFDRNQLWPQINLQGSYAANGGGSSFASFANATAGGNSPTWAVGVLFSFPLADRQARANYHMAKLDADQLLLSLKSLEQNIVVAVDDAVGHVEMNLKSVEAARAATRLAQESLDAEKKKLLAGTSTTFLVLQAQTQLETARVAQIRAEADYHESLVALDVAEGTILQRNSIVLDEKY